MKINLRAHNFKLPMHVGDGIRRAVKTTNVAFLREVGAIGRRKMRQLIGKKRTKRKGRDGRSPGASRPGEPPRKILGGIYRLTLFAIDKKSWRNKQSVVIGPKLRGRSKATRALEHGGWSAPANQSSRKNFYIDKTGVLRSTARKFYIRKRPFAKPTKRELVGKDVYSLLKTVYKSNLNRKLKKEMRAAQNAKVESWRSARGGADSERIRI